MEIYRDRIKMQGLTNGEIEAIQAASGPAGEYLDTIGKTDLAALSETEWMSFLECVITTALDKLAEISAADIPF